MTVLGARSGAESLKAENVRADDSRLAPIWRRLQSLGAIDSPFLTWEWFSSLADVSELSRSMSVLVVSEGVDPIGLVPLEWNNGPGLLRTAGFAGWRWLAPDHLDVVAPPHRREDVAGVVVRALAALREWDMLDFDGLDRYGTLSKALARHMRFPRVIKRYCEVVAAPFVVLHSADDGELFRSRTLRQQIRRGLRQSEQAGGGFSVVSDPDEVVVLLEELMKLHNERFGAGSAVFATPARRRFHRLAAHRLATANMARIYRLTAGGQDAALLYALVFGDRVFYYSMGLRPMTMSPGRTLLGQAIRSAAAEGFSEFDLLRGEHPFKQRVANGTRQDLRRAYVRPTARTFLEAARRLTKGRGAR